MWLSVRNHPRALLIDALSRQCDFSLVSVFPLPQIPRALQHMHSARGMFVVIASLWDKLFWWRILPSFSTYIVTSHICLTQKKTWKLGIFMFYLLVLLQCHLYIYNDSYFRNTNIRVQRLQSLFHIVYRIWIEFFSYLCLHIPSFHFLLNIGIRFRFFSPFCLRTPSVTI